MQILLIRAGLLAKNVACSGQNVLSKIASAAIFLSALSYKALWNSYGVNYGSANVIILTGKQTKILITSEKIVICFMFLYLLLFFSPCRVTLDITEYILYEKDAFDW